MTKVNDEYKEVERADVEAVNSSDDAPLYEKRKKIFPKRAYGNFRTFKWVVMLVSLSIYYIAPWLRWDRGEGVPDQAILIDVVNTRFYFFFVEIWPHEVYYIIAIVLLGVFAIFLFTSVFGRVWCGYTCPQTVWVDLFLVVERFCEGDRNARIKLDKQRWTASKIFKRSIKHILWLWIGVSTGGAWVFYFTDAPTLFDQFVHFEAPITTYLWVGIFTALTYLLGGFAREQVCTYMCPWPRIQAAMMDEESLSVAYRYDRGEPRAPHKKGATWDGRGDCVDCRQCVVVCPQGIDIREGLQMACIQCSLCIDACNEVMKKVDRPQGLIAYDSLANFERRENKEKSQIRIFRPRVLIYSTILMTITLVTLYNLLNKSEIDVNILRDRNPVFVSLANGDIRNGYTLKVLNMSQGSQSYKIAVEGLSDYNLSIVGFDQTLENEEFQIDVSADELRTVKLYISAPLEALNSDSQNIDFILTELYSDTTEVKETTFKSPKE